jgi:hypothetical protein
MLGFMKKLKNHRFFLDRVFRRYGQSFQHPQTGEKRPVLLARCQCYKTFLSIIYECWQKASVCPWQAFPAYSNVCV